MNMALTMEFIISPTNTTMLTSMNVCSLKKAAKNTEKMFVFVKMCITCGDFLDSRNLNSHL